jgi:hypothetical protein
VLLERLKTVVTEPAATEPTATALRLRPLLKSAEIEELRRAGSDNPEHHPRRDCQRHQRAALGKDAQLFWFVQHALGPHKTESLPQHKLALRLCDESQITVKCVIVSADQTKRSGWSTAAAKASAESGEMTNAGDRQSVGTG